MKNTETGFVSTHVSLDASKLEKLKERYKTANAAEAVIQAIDETLAYQEVLQAARRIQRRGRFGRP